MNQNDLLIQSVSEQYGAAFDMIQNIINRCEESLWQDTEGDKIISHIVHHQIYWADYYLEKVEHEKKPYEPYLEFKHKKDGNEKYVYTREELLDYLKVTRKKAETRFKGLNLNNWVEDPVFDWHGSTILSSFLYNLRHMMLHVGALHVRLNKVAKETMAWVSHGVLYRDYLD